ncbi:sulfurtransferase TusA family protein [Psychrobacter aquimaris]|uniref:sulfurtransferase TusA family protein n=1 Tax=Psychrobacter aquimaris TaxID=292733 RepID=UPI0018DFD8A1|nr:sulfurtransferase TusA family protein [Psychrobacter aquimaris]
MSADSQSTTVYAPYSISLSANFPDTEQQDINNLLDLLPAHTVNTDDKANETQPIVHIKRFVDGRGLSCPMPLLKTKVALRDVAAGESLYVVATDANSQADITAFCRQSQQADAANQLRLIVSSITDQPSEDSLSAQCFDTIYHFIITKTDSN